MHKVRQGSQPVKITGEDLARILCITIQGNLKIKFEVFPFLAKT